MPVRRDQKRKRWFFRFTATTSTGKRSIYGCPGAVGTPYEYLANTKEGALEAERIARDNLRQAAASPAPAPAPTLRVFVETVYMEKMRTIGNAKGRNKQSMLDTKDSHLRVHLLPRWGDTPLDKIDDVVIEDFKISLARRGRAVKTINNTLGTLYNILVNARARRVIANVPAIVWNRVPQQDFDFLDFDEAERLLSAASKMPEWSCAILVALKTGMRLGELRALRWEDIDLVTRKLTVRRSLWKTKYEGTPKNGRNRTIDLPASARAALKEHRHLRGERVFLNMDRADYTPGEWRAAMRTACRRAGLRRLGWHACRHSFASHLVMRGESIKVVSELLGHSTITMTNRYAHLAPGATRAAVAKLDEPVPDWNCSTVAAGARARSK